MKEVIDSVKFNIIIPTKDRADTLFWSIKTCLEQNYQNYNIWVSDNFSQDNTEQIVKGFNDQRIHYIKTPKSLSMTENWEFALEHINDGYVIFIGDDDGLLPYSLAKLSKLISQEKPDAVKWHFHRYYWPNACQYNNKIFINLRQNYYWEKINKVIKQFCKYFTTIKLPAIYHGAVNYDIIKQAKSRHKRFFHSYHSIIPDTSASLMLLAYTKKLIYSDFPFSIFGFSHHSAGLAFLNGYREEDEEKIKFYEKEYNQSNPSFKTDLEYCPSITLIFINSLIYIRRCGIVLPDFNLKDAIKAVLREPYFDEEKYLLSINVLSKIAKKNNLSSYLNKMIKLNPLIISKRYENFGYLCSLNEINLDGSKIGVNNIYEVSRVIDHIMCDINKKDFVPIDSQYNPILEPMFYYFKRGFYELIRKLIKYL